MCIVLLERILEHMKNNGNLLCSNCGLTMDYNDKLCCCGYINPLKSKTKFNLESRTLVYI